ncbi:uncharacterized protein [Triticum aestivum]|uniref:uncharacterized protein isoform X1 n=1 Tax=Triticum aestivum TaxID=4565 RepID=UPI001D007615|nr:uncharacterized protein LOC123070281 isoform X1 [Triticum aestivum]
MAGICAPKYEFGRAGSSIAGKTYTLYKRRWWKTNKCYYWCTPSSRILPCSSIHWLRPPPAAARLGSATSNLSWASAGFSVPNVAAGLPAAWLRFPLQMRLCQPSLQATLFLRWTTPSTSSPPSKPHVSYLFLFSCRMHQKARFTNSSPICFSVHGLPIGPARVSAKEPSSGSRVSPEFCATTVIELGKPCTDSMCNDECMKIFPGPGDCEKGKCLCGFC